MTLPSPNEIDALWDYGEPAASEARFREWLPAAQQDATFHACLLTQIARAQGLQRLFAAAHATLDAAQALLAEAKAEAHIRYLLERGRVHNSAGEKDKALPLFLLAWNTATVTGAEFYAVDAAHMLGIATPPAEQVLWSERALAQAEAATDPRARGWLGALYNNLGWTYHDLEQFRHALNLFARGLRFREAQGQGPQIRVARWTVARALRSLGRVGEALAMQEALLEEHARAGSSDAYVEEEIGECLLAQGRLEAARPHFARAYAALKDDPWLRDGEPARLARMARLAEVESAG